MSKEFKNIKILASNLLKDTKDNLLNLGYILPENILIIETDTNKRKISNGIHTYTELEYIKNFQILNIEKEYSGDSVIQLKKVCTFRDIINEYNITENIVSKQELTIRNTSNISILDFKFAYEENSDLYGDTLELTSSVVIPLYKKYWELHIKGHYKVNIIMEIIGTF
jgi:hypothetical protein